MPQYVVPPSYRSGQGSRVASNVKDSLALMDFLVRLKQEEMSTKIADAQYYSRQAAEEGAKTRRDKRLHQYGLEEIEKRESLQIAREKRASKEKIAEEKRVYGKEGYQSERMKLGIHKGLLSEYDQNDIITDEKGWSSIKPGALTLADKAEKEGKVFEMSGRQTTYSTDPNSEYQTLWGIFRHASSMQHPDTAARTFKSGLSGKMEAEVYYPSMEGFSEGQLRGVDVDQTPGAFTSGDIPAAIRDLSKMIEKSGLDETSASNMFHSGLSLNKDFMGSKDYQSFLQTNQSMLTAALGRQATRKGMTRTQQLIDQGSDTHQQTKNTESLNYVAKDVFGSIYNQFFHTVDDVMKTTENMSQKISDLNDVNPDLAQATRALFFQGSNYLNQGGPNTYEVYDDFFAKFIMHDEPGRGGSPSVAKQSFEAMGLSNEYKKVKDIVDGKDVRAGIEGSVEHTYVMDSALRMSEGKQQEMPFPKDVLDEYFRDVSGQPTALLVSLDDAVSRGDITYSYKRGKLVVIFDNEQDVHEFRKIIKGESPVEMQTFDSLLRNNLIDIQIK